MHPAIGNHMQMIQIQSFQLLQQIHLFIQMVDQHSLLLNLLLHQRHPTLTLLQLALHGHRLQLQLLIHPPQRLWLTLILDYLIIQLGNLFIELFLFHLLTLYRILEIFLITD